MIPSRLHISIFILSLAVTVTGYFFADRYYLNKRYDPHVQFYTAGYDFKKMQAGDADFAKYKTGGILAPTDLIPTDEDGALAHLNKPLILFAVVDPECPYCRISSDIYERLREQVDIDQVQYVPVIFASKFQNSDLTSYSHSLGFTTAFRWNQSSTPPEIFERMPMPAHILVDNQGLVLRIWFSSSPDKSVRDRMADQIASDVNLLSDVYSTSKSSVSN